MGLDKFISKRISVYIVITIASLALLIYLRMPHNRTGTQAVQPVAAPVSQQEEISVDGELVIRKKHLNKPFEPINGVENIGRGDPFLPVK